MTEIQFYKFEYEVSSHSILSIISILCFPLQSSWLKFQCFSKLSRRKMEWIWIWASENFWIIYFFYAPILIWFFSMRWRALTHALAMGYDWFRGLLTHAFEPIEHLSLILINIIAFCYILFFFLDYSIRDLVIQSYIYIVNNKVVVSIVFHYFLTFSNLHFIMLYNLFYIHICYVTIFYCAMSWFAIGSNDNICTIWNEWK